MAQKIADWLQNHKLSSHAIAAGLLGFLAFYTGSKDFADYVNSLLVHWPKIAAALVVATKIYLLYRQSQSAKGKA